jgi:hypothetical protein
VKASQDIDGADNAHQDAITADYKQSVDLVSQHVLDHLVSCMEGALPFGLHPTAACPGQWAAAGDALFRAFSASAPRLLSTTAQRHSRRVHHAIR